MKKIYIFIVIFFSLSCYSYSDEWKIKNKWKISCGIVDKEALIVNGKPKTFYSKQEFKVNKVSFKLDKGDIGKCKPDKKPSGGYSYSGRQEITHRLPSGNTIFETDIIVKGAPQARSTIFQIHDGRNKGAPPSWIGVGGDWKIINQFPKGECSPENCKMFKLLYLEPDKEYNLKADIIYDTKNKRISVKYYLDNIFFLQHLNVPISKKFTDGSYGPNKPYIKIGIYRIGETGTTIFTYNNLKIKNKKL